MRKLLPQGLRPAQFLDTCLMVDVFVYPEVTTTKA